MWLRSEPIRAARPVRSSKEPGARGTYPTRCSHPSPWNGGRACRGRARTHAPLHRITTHVSAQVRPGHPQKTNLAPRLPEDMASEERTRSPIPVHLKVFGPGGRTPSAEFMTDDAEQPRFREHLHEMRKALGGIGKDVEIGLTDAPHLTKEGTKNVLARAAGIRRTPMEEWTEPTSEDPK